MGDYVNNRLFCVGVKVSVQLMSGCGYHGVPMPGVWSYKGRIPAASAGFCRSVSDSALHLSDRLVYRAFRMEPLYQETEDGNLFKRFYDYDNDWDDHILYLEDVHVLSRGISNELLS